MLLPCATSSTALAVALTAWVAAGGIGTRAAASRAGPTRRALSSSTFAMAARPGAPRRPPKLLGPVEIAFLGTCSSAPSLTRNQQSTAVRLGGETWIFDCGEATQLQMMRARWRTSQVTRIFISHMHGDHVLGLPGMLCNVASASGAGPHHITIIGPAGLRGWLRVSLCHTHAYLNDATYSVNELTGLRAQPEAPGGQPMPQLRPPALDFLHPNELPGEDIAPDADGVWRIPRLDGEPPVSVAAAELSHRVPTVGYAMHEEVRPGALDAAKLRPVLEREGLPPSAIGRLKAEGSIALPSGGTLDASPYLTPATRRKIVVLGDLRSASSAMVALGDGCDLLVHEATNACLRAYAKDEAEVEASAIQKGHSTPQMAGRLARRMRARALALTHFSAQYSGATDEASLATMDEIAGMARAEAGDGVRVIAARDLLTMRMAIDGELDVDEVSPLPASAPACS